MNHSYSQTLIPQGKVGISATLFLEALAGESASSPVELHNEGSTAIFYHWEKLMVPRSFTKLRSQSRRPCFYFNHSSGKWKHSRTPGSTTLLLESFTCIRIFLKIYRFFFLCILLFCLRSNSTVKPQKLRSSQVKRLICKCMYDRSSDFSGISIGVLFIMR